MKIDWKSLATKLSCENSGGTPYARQALSEIIGEDAIIEAIEYYIAGDIGSELARSVLWLLHPKAGIEYCYKIYKDDNESIQRRRTAVELLRVVADESALKWANEFLNDPDEGIQNWGAGLVDQLLWSDHVQKEDCKSVLEIMKSHNNQSVRDLYKFIQEYLSDK
jgi:hypothetical protein